VFKSYHGTENRVLDVLVSLPGGAAAPYSLTSTTTFLSFLLLSSRAVRQSRIPRQGHLPFPRRGRALFTPRLFFPSFLSLPRCGRAVFPAAPSPRTNEDERRRGRKREPDRTNRPTERGSFPPERTKTNEDGDENENGDEIGDENSSAGGRGDDEDDADPQAALLGLLSHLIPTFYLLSVARIFCYCLLFQGRHFHCKECFSHGHKHLALVNRVAGKEGFLFGIF
jgi:hypothetical protein